MRKRTSKTISTERMKQNTIANFRKRKLLKKARLFHLRLDGNLLLDVTGIHKVDHVFIGDDPRIVIDRAYSEPFVIKFMEDSTGIERFYNKLEAQLIDQIKERGNE